MAFRATETFFSAAGLPTGSGSRRYQRDQVIPNEVAAELGETHLVYDDGAKGVTPHHAPEATLNGKAAQRALLDIAGIAYGDGDTAAQHDETLAEHGIEVSPGGKTRTQIQAAFEAAGGEATSTSDDEDEDPADGEGDSED